MAEAAAFDPRPLRVAATIAVLFLVVPGSGEGAALLWTLGQGNAPVPLVAPATHAMLQLAGGLMTLIWSFLALGVPHLLGLDARRARAILGPLVLVAVGLLGTVVAETTGAIPAVVPARALGFLGALLGSLMLVVARFPQPHRHLLGEAPLPVLVLALALYPLSWLSFVLEPTGLVPPGTSGEVALFLVVVPVVMSMGWKMFSAMLQLDTADAPSFFLALGSWLFGGVLVVIARAAPAAAAGSLVAGASLLFVGASLWLASLRFLRRRRGGLALQVNAGPELRLHAVVAAAMLLVSPLAWLAAALSEQPAVADLARHLVAVGFVLVVTMGVTLRALPRFCRGQPSSPRLAIATLALLLVGLALRAARTFPEASMSASLVRASAVLTLSAIVVWGIHLLRGLWRPMR